MEILNCRQIVSSCYFLLHQLHTKQQRSVFFCVCVFVFPLDDKESIEESIPLKTKSLSAGPPVDEESAGRDNWCHDAWAQTGGISLQTILFLLYSRHHSVTNPDYILQWFFVMLNNATAESPKFLSWGQYVASIEFVAICLHIVFDAQWLVTKGFTVC